MTQKRLTQLAADHKDLIERTRTLLATNFDIPARDIVSAACFQMGIEYKDWPHLNALADWPEKTEDDRRKS